MADNKLLGYNGNENLKPTGYKVDFTQEQIEEYIKCKQDPCYFIVTYCKVVSLDRGLVNFEMYPFQKDYVRLLHSERKVLALIGRQLGKTTVTSAYILHYTLFNNHKTTAILANKAAAAREVLSRIQLMYESLPKWLQHGVLSLNKGDMHLENGSKIFTAATSASGIRGKSCVTGETIVTILDGDYVFDISIEELYNSYKESFKIKTPYGFKSFKGVLNQGTPERLLQLKFTDDIHINSTLDHRFKINGEWIRCEDLNVNDILSDKIISSIVEITPETVYDIDTVEDVHCYYSNGVISHNCNFLYVDEAAIIPNAVADAFFASVYPTISSGKETKVVLTSTPLGYNHFWKYWNDAQQGTNGFVPFTVHWSEHPERDPTWADEQLKILGEIKFNQEVLCEFLGSSATLINSSSISSMSPIPYIYSRDGLDIQEAPIEGHQYIISADTSKGVGGDYSSAVIFDVTNFPYKIVGKYRDNKISPMLYPNILYKIGMEYNEAFILVEINCSKEVAQILQDDLEYENLISIKKTPKGQIPCESFSGTMEVGLNMDKKIKRIGCMTLKSLIEESKLLIFDPDIIQEFSVFIERQGSYSADPPNHDDLVMCCVIFAWLCSTSFIKDMGDVDIRKELYNQQMDYIDQQMLPVGYINDGLDEDKVEVYHF
jgi:hypothetical protein